MSDLRDSLISSFGNDMGKQAEDALNNVFINNKQAWVNEATGSYLKSNINPNETLKKIASSYRLNEEQVKRLVEETNVGIYLQKYAQTRGKANRRVEFPLADLDLVLDKTSAINQEASERGDNMSEDLAKVAFDSHEELDSVNFLNSYIDFNPKIWEDGTAEKVASTFIKRKLSRRIIEEKEKLAASIEDELIKIAFLGDALIYNQRATQSGQELMDKIASSVGGISFEVPIMNYVMKKVASLKAQRLLPNNFELPLTKTAEKNDFSLGKHSLDKQANNVTIIEVPRLPDGTDLNALVDVAKQIEEDVQKDKIKNMTASFSAESREIDKQKEVEV